VEAAPRHGIRVLTLYAFSADNWRRPPLEVRSLMRLFRSHLAREEDRCVREGVRVSVIGRRDRLSPSLVKAIESIEFRTRAGRTLHLQLAIDYSSRDAILEAAKRCRVDPTPTRERFGRLQGLALNAEDGIADVDLLIRTGGEQRLSDFLLWESAYAELVFLPCSWPDFDEGHLQAAVREYATRERRFGGLSPVARIDGPGGSHG
jgi:undecaprenyl diphosphate synthase